MDELAKRREQLMQMRTAELNRLKTARYDAREYIQDHVKYLEQQLAEVEQQINKLCNSPKSSQQRLSCS